MKLVLNKIDISNLLKAQSDLIRDPEIWFQFIEYRNQTVLTYNEPVAEAIFNMLPSFRDEVADLIKHLESLK